MPRVAKQSPSLCPEGAAAQLSWGLAPGLSRPHALGEQTAPTETLAGGCLPTGPGQEVQGGVSEDLPCLWTAATPWPGRLVSS